MIILGLDERTGFALADGFDPVRIRDALAASCANELEPPVRAEIEIVDLALPAGAEMSRRDLEEATGIGQMTLLRTLDTLIATGKVEATAPPRSPLRRYRRTAV